MTQLPVQFIQRMRETMTEDEFTSFMASYQERPRQGLRLNPLKIDRAEFVARMPFSLTPVPWCDTGFYYSEADRPGKHPYHAAGLYYIQEPSAMAVVEVLQPEAGDKVLDLCAAPGGKATHIAGCLGHTGLLVANEINAKRARALSENLERWGARHILVTNEQPEKLAERFAGFFDKIVVDAPCSGEGMFRKLPEACTDWSEAKVAQCAVIQKDILPLAGRMLKPGGLMVYSTCTFSRAENEEQIENFLGNHPEFTLEPVPKASFFQPGDLPDTVRLWPHKISGEGHFIARLRKSGEPIKEKINQPREKPIPREVRRLLESFSQDVLGFVPQGRYVLFGDQLYIMPDALPDLNRLKIVRAGWHLGTVKKDRFEPAHALAMALPAGRWQRSINLDPDSQEVYRYLKGESLPVQSGEQGWTVVTVDGYPLGWGKLVRGQLKNHYPKGLRWL